MDTAEGLRIQARRQWVGGRKEKGGKKEGKKKRRKEKKEEKEEKEELKKFKSD